MTRSFWQSWKEDSVLKLVFKNTSYLFSSNLLATLVSSGQVLLATLLLGAAEYGLLALIIDFTSNVNRLLSFRMGELIIRYAGEALANGDRQRAAAVVKLAALAEGITSLAAFGLLVVLAPLASTWILQDASLTPWLRFYGLALALNAWSETATAVLQLAERFRQQAALHLAQSLVTFGGIAAAFAFEGGVWAVLMAYLAGKAVNGLGLIALGTRALGKLVGNRWIQAPFTQLADRKELARFAFTTNLSATINLVVRDSETLWIGALLSPLFAGYYRLALTIIGLIMMPINPLIQTTFPTISRMVAEKKWPNLRRLLGRTSTVAAVWTLGCAVGLGLLGGWVLAWYKGGEYAPAWPALMILLIGYGFANIFFWNRPLLLALGRPTVPLLANGLAGAVKTGLMLLLVPAAGYLAQAGLLSGYFLVSVGVILWAGFRELRCREQSEEPA